MEDVTLVQVLRHLLKLVPSSGPIVGSSEKFRSEIRRALVAVGVEHLGFASRSIRRGGATHDFRCHGSYHIAADRGRWRSVETCRIYIADAVATVVLISLSKKQTKKKDKYCKIWATYVAKWGGVE